MNNSNFCSSCGGAITGGNNCPNCGAAVIQPMNNNMNMSQNQMINNQNVMGVEQTQSMNNPNMMGMNSNQMMGNNMNMINNNGMNMQKWTNTNAIWALVLEGISFFVFGFLAPVGLGLGIRSLNESKQHGNQGKTLSILSIVIGVLFTILYVIAVVGQQ